MSNKSLVLLSASFGGISPNLFRLATTLTQEGGELPGLTYLIGLAIFAGMGLMVALIWGETDVKKAFYLGIGLPAFIQMSAVQNQLVNEEQLRRELESQSLIPIEHILDQTDVMVLPAALPQETGRKIIMTIDNFRQKTAMYSFVFSNDSGDRTEEVKHRYQEDRLTWTIPVPDWAESFQVKVRKSLSEPIPLDPNEQRVAFRCSVTKGVWSGLMEAIGLGSERDLDISLTREG